MGSAAGLPEVRTTEPGFMVDLRRAAARDHRERAIAEATCDTRVARKLRKSQRVAVDAGDGVRREGAVWKITVRGSAPPEVQVVLDPPPPGF